jgi:hypothetical protein
MKILDCYQIKNQKEFSTRQFRVPKDASLTYLKITERHHSHPPGGWGKWDQENGSKTGRPITVKSIERKREFMEENSGI